MVPRVTQGRRLERRRIRKASMDSGIESNLVKSIVGPGIVAAGCG